MRTNLLLLLILLLGGCAHSPTVDVLGSYFPAWMLCIIIGLFSTLIVRLLLIGFGIYAHLVRELSRREGAEPQARDVSQHHPGSPHAFHRDGYGLLPIQRRQCHLPGAKNGARLPLKLWLSL